MYGLEVWNSTGGKRLSITSRTALFYANFAGTYTGPISVPYITTGSNWALMDHVNGNDDQITISAGTVTITGAASYNFTVIRF